MGTIESGVTDGIGEIVISAPTRRNAITQAMWSALVDAATGLASDPAVRAVIVRGEGETFSAGADISEFAGTYATAEATAAYAAAVSAAQRALAALPRPVLAAVEGAAFGGGCGIALAADLRFAAAGARFSIPPAKIGAAYSFADTRQLVDLVGPARAKDILFSGRVLDAAEALRIGLVDRLVPDGEAAAAARAYAVELARLSATSITQTKRTVEAIRSGADEPDAALEAAFLDSFAGTDFREGYTAFLAKRPPRFR